MNIEELVNEFETFNTEQISDYKDLLSTKINEKIFPPYIPHIGKKYKKYNLMMYGMAQSIAEPWDTLKIKNKSEKVKQLYDAIDYKNIWIAPYKVMLALAGVYIYATHNNSIDSFNDIHNSIAATNYYKFSFSENGKDINPNSDLEKYKSPELYWNENDRLSKIELQFLKPAIVLSFNGRHNKIIKEAGFNFIKINDPSWILQGGGGVLKKNGSWDRKIDDDGIHILVDKYLEQIDGKYTSKRDAIRIYLMKYYADWKNT